VALVVDHVEGFGARCIEGRLVVDHVLEFDARRASKICPHSRT
jgi:hypothetical protein